MKIEVRLINVLARSAIINCFWSALHAVCIPSVYQLAETRPCIPLCFPLWGADTNEVESYTAHKKTMFSFLMTLSPMTTIGLSLIWWHHYWYLLATGIMPAKLVATCGKMAYSKDTNVYGKTFPVCAGYKNHVHFLPWPPPILICPWMEIHYYSYKFFFAEGECNQN